MFYFNNVRFYMQAYQNCVNDICSFLSELTCVISYNILIKETFCNIQDGEKVTTDCNLKWNGVK